MADNTHATSNIQTIIVNAVDGKKKLWIISCTVAGILMFAAIVVPTTIISTRKNINKPTTIIMKTTEKISSTINIQEITSTKTTLTAETKTLTMTVEENIDLCLRRYSSIANYEIDSYLNLLYSADIDNDNRSDIIVSDWSLLQMNILYNNGNSTFITRNISSTSSRPFSSLIVDVNNDGKLDISVVDFQLQQMIIFINNGNRIFTEYANYPIDQLSTFLIAADINNDEYRDMIIGSIRSQNLTIYFNNGNGTFSEQVDYYPLNTTPSFIGSADFNDDHSLDIIILSDHDKLILIIFNNGHGKFPTGMMSYLDSHPISAVVIDVNGDEKQDLIVTFSESNKNHITIFLNVGIGQFIKYAEYSTDSQPFLLTVEDVSNDGKLDIVTGNRRSSNIDIFLNIFDEKFTRHIVYSIGFEVLHLVISDINDDDRLDIIVANTTSIGVLYTYCP